MKKLILLTLLSMSKFLYGQTNTFPTSGNIGIGTTTPTTKLEILGGTDWTSNYWKKSMKLNNSQAIQFSANAGYFGIGATDPEGLYFFSTTTNDIGAPAKYLLMMRGNGNIGIGTITPNEKLSVNGNIRAHEIKVETASWPDYVFAKDYELPSLDEIERNIKENGHLPSVPSAEEVKEKGINIGEMNATLLKKIEELTLYMIELNKIVKNQQHEINQLKSKKQLD